MSGQPFLNKIGVLVQKVRVDSDVFGELLNGSSHDLVGVAV